MADSAFLPKNPGIFLLLLLLLLHFEIGPVRHSKTKNQRARRETKNKKSPRMVRERNGGQRPRGVYVLNVCCMLYCGRECQEDRAGDNLHSVE